jgi:hypothetical protein
LDLIAVPPAAAAVNKPNANVAIDPATPLTCPLAVTMLTGSQEVELTRIITAASPVLLPLTPRATPSSRSALVPTSTGLLRVLTGATTAVLLGVLVVAGPGFAMMIAP